MDLTSVIPVSYGRACMNCSRSKCKCIVRSGSDGCERCHRLHKPCCLSDSIRKRSREKNTASRIAQWEGKLDNLVSLLQPVTESTPSTVLASSLTLNARFHAKGSPVDQLLGASTLLPAVSCTSPSNARSFTPGSSWTECSSSSLDYSVFQPSHEEAGECLGMFRTQMLRYFPFLHLPLDTSAQQLQQHRPFLFLSIVAVTSKSAQKKSALNRQIKQVLAQSMFLDNEGSVTVDLLLGLLTFLVWSNDPLLNNTPTTLSRFTHLAMTLVFDLHLNKSLLKGANMHPHVSSQQSPAARTSEERRAVLGCFFLSSIVSSYFGQIDAMQWTPYMDECLDLLIENRESPSDERFVHQVRLQLLSQRVSQAKLQARGVKQADGTIVPPGFYLKALQLKLQELKRSISPGLQQDVIIVASLYYAELSIHDIAFSKAPITLNRPGFQRLECLYSCLSTVKSAFDNFFRLPLDAYIGISFPFFTQLAQCVVVLYKLSTLDDPAWDKSLVRSTIDLLLVLDRIIHNLEQASETSGDGFEEGIFARTTKTFMSIRFWCGAKLAYYTGQSDNIGFQASVQNGMLQEPISLDSIDDIWLRDILASWDNRPDARTRATRPPTPKTASKPLTAQT